AQPNPTAPTASTTAARVIHLRIMSVLHRWPDQNLSVHVPCSALSDGARGGRLLDGCSGRTLAGNRAKYQRGANRRARRPVRLARGSRDAVTGAVQTGNRF